MNRNDFINMIQDSSVIDRQMIGEVRELLDLFPYFQSAHMLLLKGLHNTADVRFENQLKQSALHIADREVLYYLLKRVIEPAAKENEKIPEPKPSEISAPDSTETVIQSGKSSDELIKEIEKNSDEIRTGEQIKIPEQVISGHSILISSESDITESGSVMILIDEDAEPFEERVIFMDPAFSIPDRDELLELDLQVKGSSELLDETSNQKPPDLQEKNSKKQLQSDLINKFIVANPRIEPVREKSNQPVEDISKQFAEEKGGFVTETLAKIYVNQGYYSKAIDIYEKLSLKFPEKSSYFASQIEKVKGFIK
jgi:tetratricopeptide (TPR) repeat protein